MAALVDAHPLIVTRKRYERWIPLISHLIRLYQYPVVDPTANAKDMKASLRQLRNAAKECDVPFVIFPEGTRTKDGEVGPFKTTGLKLVLKQRPWTVYVLVGDGFWKRAKLKDLLGGMDSIRGTLSVLGPFAWDDPKGDPEAFAAEMRALMVERLAELRAALPA